MWRRRVPTVQTVQMTTEILQVLPVEVVEVRQTQFIVRFEQRQVPTAFQFLDKVVGKPSQVLTGVQYIDKVVDVLGITYGGFWKNSSYYLRVACA